MNYVERVTQWAEGRSSVVGRRLGATRNGNKTAIVPVRDAENTRGEAMAMWSIGKVDLAAGDNGAARSAFAYSLRAFREFGMNSELLGSLESYAELLARLELPRDALRRKVSPSIALAPE